MIKLIASDLDGTLLQNGAQELTPRALDLIHRLTEKGIHFAAASGRQYANERRLFAPIRDEISYIAKNGSLCICQGKVISRGIIPDDLAFRILRELKKERHLEIVVSREDTCLIEDNDPAFVNHIIHVLKNRTEIVPDITQIQGPVIKIAVACMSAGPELMDRYLRVLNDKFGAEIKVVTSGNIWIDFIAPDANKGTALSALLNTLHIRPEECMAFGDQYNDVEMLELAGTSYAMSGAAPGISRYASHVTDSVEDVLEDLLGRLT
ncbi:MAG TPA: Cof-type HAD-IIB family hydrolase [Candidatus Mediterraneibacter stercoravium]|uniref:Cof-type HAD-IIB family hydrolase n=1 Tax=Candidatus Mediterraneibacter stercoravium TaxID=2838685 RepID=A0A9D2GAG4_9FIRM|nr:Cof-type HAD-IIB family hydrolase [Candidatus Mediterraneibacter stercoravium]